jgi:2-oxoglutarate dehydrogenase E2 component (dihydrolipoamide succinyltransferase)
MATEIRVPTLGESVSEATIGRWFKKPGDAVKADEPLVELETDKVTLEVNAPAAGVLGDIAAKDGETVAVGALLGSDQARAARAPPAAAGPRLPRRPHAASAPTRPRAAAPPASQAAGRARARSPRCANANGAAASPPSGVAGSGPAPDGRVTKGDMLAHRAPRRAGRPAGRAPVAGARALAPDDAAREERVRMTKLRQTIARRLKEAQNTAAMLTTFNEVDMSAVMELRKPYKDVFEKKHGVKLGFMGFFVKACVAGAEGHPGRQRRDRRHRHRLQELLPHRRRGRHREGPRRAGGARRRPAVAIAEIEKRSPISASAPATGSSRSRRCRAAPSRSPTAASTAR